VAGRATPCCRWTGGRMIKTGRRPSGGRGVTARALCGGWHMGRRLGLRVLCQIGATVAGRALRQPRMVHHRGRPACKAVDVAGVALAGDRNVVHRFAQGIGKAVGTTMTGRTLPRRPTVVHPRRLETDKVVVATVALRAARNMRARLAQGRRAVVAARTGSCRRRRVNIESSGP